MQTAAGHDIGVAPKNAGRDFLHLHDIEQAQFAPLMVEKEIDVRTPGARRLAAVEPNSQRR